MTIEYRQLLNSTAFKCIITFENAKEMMHYFKTGNKLIATGNIPIDTVQIEVRYSLPEKINGRQQ